MDAKKDVKRNYWILARKFYLIFQKDWAYASNKPRELGHLKNILNLVTEEKFEEICRYVYRHEDARLRRFGAIRGMLDELVEKCVSYDSQFEIEEGYKYTNRVEKRRAYEEWLNTRK